MGTTVRQPTSMSRELFNMTWPMLFGVLSLMSFQLVDSAFIGQLGVQPLAAQGFTIPMHMLMIGIQVGLGIATTALISKAIGAGLEDQARKMGGLIIVLGALAMLFMTLMIWFSRSLLLAWLGADSSVMPHINAYWVSWLISAWFGALLYFGYSICRAHGNTRLPGALMVTTSLLNMLLDPIFIFVFDWGLPGAAWATLVSVMISLVILYPRVLANHWIESPFQDFDFAAACRELAGISGPAMLGQLLPSMSSMIATTLVATFGSAAVAAWGLGVRLEFFSIMVVLALTMSMPPMVGRFLGAQEHDKILQLVQIALKFVLLWHLVIALVWLIIASPTANLLSTDSQVSDIVRQYTTIVPLSYGPLGVCMVMVSVCNAIGMPMRALTISFVRLFGCYIPALWVGGALADLQGLLIGACIGNIMAGLLAWQLFKAGFHQLQNSRQKKVMA